MCIKKQKQHKEFEVQLDMGLSLVHFIHSSTQRAQRKPGNNAEIGLKAPQNAGSPNGFTLGLIRRDLPVKNEPVHFPP
jgi:hypothetical protein